MKPDILSLSRDELRELVISLGEPRFRADQLFGWMQKGAPLDEMRNLPAAFRDLVARECEYRLPVIERRLESALDDTVKYVFRLIDGECVESVFMRYEHGTSVCVSSQVGCAMGCKFCASTIGGRVRDLTAGEILGQVIAVGRDRGERIDGVVMMGIGEPLDNYDNTVRFLRLISAPEGLNIGLRHISVSTCGIVPRIRDLAGEGLPVTLSVSLHAPTDAERRAIMPVNRRWGIADLTAACRDFFERTGRRISFEYTLIGGKNDGGEDAARLASLLRREVGSVVHVNLIPVNEVRETGLRPPSRAKCVEFCEALKRLGVNATIRRTRGADINASCGQLRRAAQSADARRNES